MRVQGGFDLDTLLTILLQTVSALKHLHARGILHRDLRASNVLVSHPGELHRLCVLLADFGLSHALSGVADGGTPSASAAGTVVTGRSAVGPLQWSAPEVRAGCVVDGGVGVVATPASDVYMFGCLMYELLTGGTAPFAWLARNEGILTGRLTSVGPVEVDGVPTPLPGLCGLNVFGAAALDGKAIPWCTAACEARSPAAAVALRELCARYACCHGWPRHAPALQALADKCVLVPPWVWCTMMRCLCVWLDATGPDACPWIRRRAPGLGPWAPSCANCWAHTAAGQRMWSRPARSTCRCIPRGLPCTAQLCGTRDASMHCFRVCVRTVCVCTCLALPPLPCTPGPRQGEPTAPHERPTNADAGGREVRHWCPFPPTTTTLVQRPPVFRDSPSLASGQP
jgi:hypothetical protein